MLYRMYKVGVWCIRCTGWGQGVQGGGRAYRVGIGCTWWG